VLVVACTNRLDALDSALLRPGRLGDHFLLDRPTCTDLKHILSFFLSSVPLDDDVDLDSISELLHEREFTGADVEGLCRDVCLASFSRHGNITNGDDDDHDESNFALTSDDFLKELMDSA